MAVRFTAYLKEEHKKLKAFFNYLSEVVGRLEKGGEISSSLANIIKIGEVFQDYHRIVEDELLFPYLQVQGLTGSSGPFEVLSNEHRVAADYLEELRYHLDRVNEEQGDKERTGSHREKAVELIKAYIHLMLAHTGKEEMVIFPMLDSMLSSADEVGLKAKAEEESAKMNQIILDLYQEDLERLRTEFAGTDLHQEELRFLWNLMHNDPQEVLKGMNHKSARTGQEFIGEQQG